MAISVWTSASLLLLAAAAASASPLNTLNSTDVEITNWNDFKSVDVNIEPVELLVPVKGISSRIIGGRAASRGQFPWQAALYMDGSSFCGGSLISSNLVLTAAHCTDGARRVTVYLGALDRSQSSESSRQTFQSTQIYNHLQYNRNTIDYDIAVVRLPSSALLNTYVSTVILAPSNWGTLEGLRCRTSGWGRTSDASSASSAILRYVDLNVISNTVCARTFGNLINSAKVCVSTEGGVATCNGDSGGPLVYRNSQGYDVQVGITSFGSAQGCAVGYPKVFTRVSSYTDNFIRQYM